MSFTVIEVSEPEILTRIFKFRVESWLTTDALNAFSNLFPLGSWQDNHESCGRHWAVFDGEHLLAAARLCVHKSLSEIPYSHLFADLNFEVKAPIASINRLVVHTDYRRMGLSKKLDQVRILAAEQAGCSSIFASCWLVSGTARLQSLVKQGFEITSPLGFHDEPPFGACTTLILKLPKRL